MLYVEYENATKLVSKIHATEPESVQEGYSIAKSDSFDIGMEMEFVITVDKVDQNGFVISSSTTKQVTPAYQLLRKIDELEIENATLKSSLADLWETILVAGGSA